MPGSRCLFALAAGLVLAWVVPGWSAPPSPAEVTAIIFLSDNNELIYAGVDEYLHVWDMKQSKERLRIHAHTNGVYGLALSNDGKQFASAGADRLVRLWDSATLKEVRTFEGHRKEAVGVAFSPNNRVLASCAYDGTIRLWDTSTGKELRVLRGHRHKVTSVAFSPDGTILASGGFVPFETESFKGSTQGDQVRLWDPESGKELRRLPVKGQRVAIAPDGKTLIASAMYLDLAPAGQGGLVFGNMSFDGGSRITVWDMQRNRERYRLDEYWTGLAISADGRYLASSWGSRLHGGGTVLTHQSKSKGVHVWELETGKEMLAFTAPEGTGTVLAFAPDARRLIAGCQDGKLRIWDLNAQREKK